MNKRYTLEVHGWCRFDFDPALAAWVTSVFDAACGTAKDPTRIREWLRCGDTWFAGVNSLPNDSKGRVNDGCQLCGEAIELIEALYGPLKVDRAQISIIYPGYPQPMEGESAGAFRFRRDRDAAHVDGLLPLGPNRRRYLQEPHSYVLGVPLNTTSIGASPMVVWSGSHLIMRQAFREALDDVPTKKWTEIDLTEIYKIARRRCFEECERVIVHGQPGEAYLVHRLALHGVAPWKPGAVASEEGRMIAYFRPELEDISNWLA